MRDLIVSSPDLFTLHTCAERVNLDIAYICVLLKLTRGNAYAVFALIA